MRKLLPKYSTGAQKKKKKKKKKKKAQQIMSLIMTNKIAWSPFRVICQELTGDKSVADNKLCMKADERMQLILKTADETIIRDLRMNNGGHTKQFNAFWDVTEEKLNELQATDINDKRHTVAPRRMKMLLPIWLLLFPLNIFTSSAIPKLNHKEYKKNKHRLYRGSDFISSPKIIIPIRQWTTLVV